MSFLRGLPHGPIALVIVVLLVVWFLYKHGTQIVAMPEASPMKMNDYTLAPGQNSAGGLIAGNSLLSPSGKGYNW